MQNVGLTSPNVQVISSLQSEKTVTAYFKLKLYVLFGFARYICTSQCECTEIFSSEDSGITPQHSTPLQSKMAVNVYLKSNQLLPFGFVRHNTHLEIRKKVTAYLKSKTLLPFCFTEQSTAHVTGGSCLQTEIQIHKLSQQTQDVDLMLGQRRGLWTSIKTTLGQHRMFAWIAVLWIRITQTVRNVDPMLF